MHSNNDLKMNQIAYPMNISTYHRFKKNEIPVFGYMGGFDIKKFGIDLILHAFADYKHKYLETGSLWLIGDGKDKNNIIELSIQLSIDQYVQIKPMPFGNQKFDLLHQIDLFLRPSRSEYFPTAVLEAAAVSVPSIVAADSILSESINTYNAGFIMQEYCHKHLVKFMLATLKDIKYNDWSIKKRNAQRMANERFHWNKIPKTHFSYSASTI